MPSSDLKCVPRLNNARNNRTLLASAQIQMSRMLKFCALPSLHNVKTHQETHHYADSIPKTDNAAIETRSSNRRKSIEAD